VSDVEKRDLIESLVRKIEVKPENRLQFYFSIQSGGPFTSTTVTLRKQSSEAEVNGGVDGFGWVRI
jgi:hypothetical protein